MARIKIEAPDNFDFKTEMSLRISDINYGGHLGHDAILSLIHEARVRFFTHYGFTELHVDGPGIMLADVAIYYKSECFYGDVLIIEIAVCDFLKYGCDLVYKITNQKSGREVAIAKTGMVFMNYQERSVVHVPEKFKELFNTRSYKIEIQNPSN